jgi:hypothetical protein
MLVQEEHSTLPLYLVSQAARQPGSQAADHQWDRSAGRALSRPS